MLDYEINPYYYPENLGLQIVGAVDVAGDYEFDILCVWVDPETHELYWQIDSGCSCPTPFEDIKGREDLVELTHDNWKFFFDTAQKHVRNSWDHNTNEVIYEALTPDMVELISLTAKLLA